MCGCDSGRVWREGFAQSTASIVHDSERSNNVVEYEYDGKRRQESHT